MASSLIKITGALALAQVARAAALYTPSIPVVSQFPVPTNNPVGCSPTGSSSSPTQSFTVNYNFETVERGVSGLTLTHINEYNLLNFDLDWINTDPDLDGNHLGIAPHTYPDVAVFSANTQTVGESPSISASYLESTISSFDAQSFWYGCVFPTEESAGSLPTSCTITATGFNSAGQQVATQEFAFKANGSVVQDLNYGKFQGFNKIYTLNFTVTNEVATAAILDDFIATLYQPSCAPNY